VVWVVFAVLLVLAGALVWAVRSGHAPERVRRGLSWWLDVDDPPAWAARPPGMRSDFDALASPELSEARMARPDGQASATPGSRQQTVLAQDPVAAVPAVVADVLPEISLADVALHLKEQRYRAHPVHVPEAEPALPVVDQRVILDNLRSRKPRSAAAQPTALPVIGTDEVEQNLQQLASRARPVRQQPVRPLPVIDADEVRASLQQIHGSRMRSRASRLPESATVLRSPASPTAPVLPTPSSPLLKSSMVDRAPATFVPAPASRPPVSPHVSPQPQPQPQPQLEPTPPAVAISPIPVVPLVAAPTREYSAPALSPRPPQPPVILPVVVAVNQSLAIDRVVLPELPEDDVLLAPQTPASPAAAATPLVWHDIEERQDDAEPPFAAECAQDNAAQPPVESELLCQGAEPPPFSPGHGGAAPRVQPRPAYDPAGLPSLDLLKPADLDQEVCSDDALLERGIVIEEKLAEFKVKVSVVDAYAGPVITRFEVEPAVGVRGSQVVNLIKDLARALGLASIRVVETIPGKTCMGLELPNPVRQMIRLSEIFSSEAFNQPSDKLLLALGKDITGEPVVMDLARAPHLLVAGTTGSGKSVGVNAMILSLLYRFTPDDVRFIMIDPKMLELSVYNDIPHLLAPVVTDMKLAANALNWCVGEMEKRYRLMSALGVRNLAGYNDKVRTAQEAGQSLKNPFSLTPDDPEPLELLPAIVVVVDEFADLMMVAGKKIEELIARLAQKARAAGLHLILATQRPSVDVITGLIKANIPTRIAFQVSSKVDSRTILDQMGAEALLGQGDMLYLPPGSGYPQRIHGAFVADDEVHAVVQVLKQFGEPDYIDGLLTGESELDENAAADGAGGSTSAETDPLYDEAVEIVLRTRRASISSVQRHLRIGYNRAARLIEEMEAAGLVSAMEHNGSRTVLVPQREG
jgi:S-DNA-T family DNA segregation ATPase FtsK/SpoIIIE